MPSKRLILLQAVWLVITVVLTTIGDAARIPSLSYERIRAPSKMTSAAADDPAARLGELGLSFDNSKILRQFVNGAVVPNSQFTFDVHDGNHAKNQARYEEIGKLIDEIVYSELEESGLERIYFPQNAERQFFFFASPHFPDKEDLVVLIHGAPPVRAGQWARSLIINHGMDEGSMLSFVDNAQRLGAAVVCLNTNYNKVDGKTIEGSESPEQHAITVWNEYIATSKAKRIAVLAHSYGGVVTLELAKKFAEDFASRVVDVSLTDSVHYKRQLQDRPDVRERLRVIGMNYVRSKGFAAGTTMPYRKDDVPRSAAGHNKHEWTTFAARREIFKRWAAAIGKKQDNADVAKS